jgi:hypothetical protein
MEFLRKLMLFLLTILPFVSFAQNDTTICITCKGNKHCLEIKKNENPGDDWPYKYSYYFNQYDRKGNAVVSSYFADSSMVKEFFSCGIPYQVRVAYLKYDNRNRLKKEIDTINYPVYDYRITRYKYSANDSVHKAKFYYWLMSRRGVIKYEYKDSLKKELFFEYKRKHERMTRHRGEAVFSLRPYIFPYHCGYYKKRLKGTIIWKGGEKIEIIKYDYDDVPVSFLFFRSKKWKSVKEEIYDPQGKLKYSVTKDKKGKVLREW